MASNATTKTPGLSRIEQAHSRLDLLLHFEATFERILKEHGEAPKAAAVEALAREAVDWIEELDAFLANKAA